MIRLISAVLLVLATGSVVQAQDRTLPAGAYRGLDAAARVAGASSDSLAPLQNGRSEATSKIHRKIHRKHHTAD